MPEHIEPDLYAQGYDLGYETCIRDVMQEAERMFRLDAPMQARFRWVMQKVDKAGVLAPAK